MSQSKKIFRAFAVAFFLVLMYVVYDISTHTTFPGSKPTGKETQEKIRPAGDSVNADSVR